MANIINERVNKAGLIPRKSKAINAFFYYKYVVALANSI